MLPPPRKEIKQYQCYYCLMSSYIRFFFWFCQRRYCSGKRMHPSSPPLLPFSTSYVGDKKSSWDKGSLGSGGKGGGVVGVTPRNLCMPEKFPTIKSHS